MSIPFIHPTSNLTLDKFMIGFFSNDLDSIEFESLKIIPTLNRLQSPSCILLQGFMLDKEGEVHSFVAIIEKNTP